MTLYGTQPVGFFSALPLLPAFCGWGWVGPPLLPVQRTKKERAGKSCPLGILIQLQIVPWMERTFSPTLYHVAVARFVREYWGWALDCYPMIFGLLNRTRVAVKEAQILDDKAMVRSILHTIAFSLDVQMPEYVRSWLDG